MSVLTYRGVLPDGFAHASEIAQVLGLPSTKTMVSVNHQTSTTQIVLPIDISKQQETALSEYLGAGLKKIV